MIANISDDGKLCLIGEFLAGTGKRTAVPTPNAVRDQVLPLM